MAVVTKVTSKVTLSAKPKAVAAPLVRSSESSDLKDENGQKSARSKKYCHFCKTKLSPRYWDAVVLRRFLNDRGRIYPRTRSGACAKHQRRISREIKRARHLALLPFTIKI